METSYNPEETLNLLSLRVSRIKSFILGLDEAKKTDMEIKIRLLNIQKQFEEQIKWQGISAR